MSQTKMSESKTKTKEFLQNGIKLDDMVYETYSGALVPSAYNSKYDKCVETDLELWLDTDLDQEVIINPNSEIIGKYY